MTRRLKLIVPLAVLQEFLVTLAEGRYAKLSVGLVLPHDALAPEGAEGAEAKPPEGYGPLAQEALVRAIVTDPLTGARPRPLCQPQPARTSEEAAHPAAARRDRCGAA